MNNMIRSLGSTLGAAVIVCACAGALLGATAVAFDHQESGGAEQQRNRPHDELTFTQIDFPGAMLTVALGINDRGQIVGAFSDRDQIVGRFNDFNNAAGSHGFLLDDGAFMPIDVPGAPGTVAFGITDRGQIVSSFIDEGGAVHGFLLDDGAFTEIDFPAAVLTTGNGISKRGQIVGTFIDAGDVAHGYMLEMGVSPPSIPRAP